MVEMFLQSLQRLRKKNQIMTEQPTRAYMPHCDSQILHEPGACEYCDEYPDWQHYRVVARIAFTGTDEELGSEKLGLAPCPSTRFRKPETRDRWYGNLIKKG